MQDDIRKLIATINRRQLKNNTQKALFTLLTSKTEWVNRNSVRIPSAAARLRDLRKPQFGGFQVECASASMLKRRVADPKRTTYYRINPSSLTADRLAKAFKGVI